MGQLLAIGAEAEILKEGSFILKRRIRKDYRISPIDLKIRLFRTKRETKVMRKLFNLINVPEIISFNDFEIKMELIDGIPLFEMLDCLKHLDRDKLFMKIGMYIGVMHYNEVIHGDLTTANILIKNNEVCLIDFGLSFFSIKPEDMAVDLHLMWQSINSMHHQHAQRCFEVLLQGYKRKCKNYKAVFQGLEKVRARGRYKGKIKSEGL